MPIPQHSTALPSIQIAPDPVLDGLTEVRVHGVGGTPPDKLLEDLSPEQVSGDQIAGFYRTSDRRAAGGTGNGIGSGTGSGTGSGMDQADRHVECYSWGGLTSATRTRVLWLALLPFLFGNLAGWMCTPATRSSAIRFRFHRAALGLGALALTVNAALLAAVIGLNVLSYQAVRTGAAAHQWWLAPLTWPSIAGHPARQLIVGAVVIEVLLAALLVISGRSWRYEAVRPPAQVDAPRVRPRLVTAAALDDGLANENFWDGEHSVRQFTWIHSAAFTAYLAIVLGVTAHALPGTAGQNALWTIAIVVAAAAEVLAVGYICLDAAELLTEGQRRWPFGIFIVSAAGLVCAGVFAWLRPGAVAGSQALPSMSGITAATVAALAVPVVLAAVSVLAGGRARGTLAGGPLVTLLLGLSVLNGVAGCVMIWVAHLVGPVTGDAASSGKIYLPAGLSSGVPLQAWAAVAAAVGFLAVEAVRWLRASHLPPDVLADYRNQAVAHLEMQEAQLRPWFTPPEPDQGWERKIARTRLIAGLAPSAGWLLWAVVAAQIAAALSSWLLRWQMPVVIRDAGVTVGGLLLPTLMGVLYAAWSDPVQRRHICMLWDVGTFWPRSYHPLAPPCYSERAIPELQRRLWWVHDNGGRVLLVSHSQGTMLAVAALSQAGCRPREHDHPLLVTFGSPLCKLYGWGFPAYVTSELLTPLAPGGGGRVDDWRNFSYPTDPIGGPVSQMITSPGGASVDDVLPDPAEYWHVYAQPAPAPGGHSGYWTDRRVWREINRMTDETLPAPPPS
jgi:hypothetical protein